MNITPQQARAELARRELERRNASAGKNENLLQKVVRYGIKDPAIGILNMGREFANLPNKVSGGRIPEFSPSDFDFSEALGVENPDTADQILQFAGQYGPSLAIPGVGLGRAGQAIGSIPKVGKIASSAVSQAIPQGLYSAAQAPSHAIESGAETAAMVTPFAAISEIAKSSSPKVRTLAKILAGGGTGLIGHETAKSLGAGETASNLIGLLSGGLAARGVGSTRDMMERMTEGVNPSVASERLAAAERLGLDYLTPAEAGVSPWAAKRQGSLGRTEEGGQLLYERALKRQKSEKDAIERTLEQIYSPHTMDSKVEDAYRAINQVNLPKEFPLQFKDNEIINEAKRLVEKTPAYKESLKALMPKNVKLEPGQSDPQATSLLYWDHVKRALDDMVSKAERAGNANEARIISNTRRDMRNQMDAAFPEYADARALYERKKVREGLEKVFDRKAVTGTNFYRALESDKKFDELMRHLKNAPEAAENLKDMRLLFKDLMGPPTIKTAKGKEEYGMNQPRSSGSFLETLMEHAFTRGGNDVAAIDFITSKDWSRQLKEINRISDRQLKMAALAMVLGKGVGQAVGQQER